MLKKNELSLLFLLHVHVATCMYTVVINNDSISIASQLAHLPVPER